MMDTRNFAQPDIEIIKEHYYDATINLDVAAKRCGVSQATLSKIVRVNNLPSRTDLGISPQRKRRREATGPKKDRTKFVKNCPGCKYYKFCKALPITEPVKCETRWSSDDVPIDTDTGYVRSVGLGDAVRIS